MGEEEQVKKSCENCKYFSQYYVKHKTYVIPVNCGNCTKRKISSVTNKNFPFSCGCNFWADNGIKKQEQNQSIKNILTTIEKRIHNIELILKNE